MYVENELRRLLSKYSKGKIDVNNVEDYLKEKDVFYTLEEAKDDMELETLEEVMETFFVVVDKDKLLFIGDEIFDEWF